MIRIENLTKKYNKKLVLDNLNISFQNNSINIITGSSGCGKTTLFNIISGIDNSYEGKLLDIPENIAYLFQEDRLLPFYSVLDNVLFTIPDNIPEEQRHKIAKDNISKMGLEEEINVLPHELSGGMSRRASIARALSYPSELLLLDEPFNGLNIELKKSIVDAIIENMKINNKTVILITHDTSILEYFDDVNIINLDK